MPTFAELLQQGSAHAWLFVPSAIFLGALHGLEPGHSKTMMAAFIVAIGGTVGQAVLLGLAATVSHTAIVWGIALGGLYLWQGVAPDELEPWFQLLSGAAVIAIAVWMFWRTWNDRHPMAATADSHTHDHGHDHLPGHTLTHIHGDVGRPMAGEGEFQDAHQRTHASDIQRRFAGRPVTNGQIALFGLTGGLIPCPAAITVLLLCLQLKELALGVVLVLCFSIGLAITLVVVGGAAALGVRQASGRWTWFDALARRSPYVSSLLIVAIGLYVGIQGWIGLSARAA